MDDIKYLLFDLGGVIMDIRRENCVEAFRKLGLRNADSYFGDFVQHGPFMSLERGDIDTAEFHRIIRADLPTGVSDEEIDHAFCQFLVGIPPHRLNALEQLHRNYGVGLLSNTNPIMWYSAIKKEFEKLGKNIEHYFDGIVTSFEANALKPEEKIYRYAVQKLGIDPCHTLFLDDSQANLDAASRLGFHTALVPSDGGFEVVLKQILG